MYRMITLVVAIMVWGLATGFAVAQAEPPDLGDALRSEYPDGLPRYETPEEQQLPYLLPPAPAFGFRAPPGGLVRCPAEYEPQEGLFIAWESYQTTVLKDLAVMITNNDPNATVYVVVDTASEQTSAYNTLNSYGANMSQISFIVRQTDSVWIRDYGPRFIFEYGNRAVVDHTYNRPSRYWDNLFNDYLCSYWSEPQYQIPLEHGGGNFHLFADGDAFMTTLILTENPGVSQQQVIDYYAEYQGLNLTLFTGFPTYFDSTQHIDMWMLPVADKKVIIGRYSSSTGQPYTITEGATQTLQSRGYTVYRTPGWNSGGTHYTYTNAVVLNDHVYVPSFGGSYALQDAEALDVFAGAFPDRTVHQINCSGIIGAAGAIHCVVMHVPNLPVTGDANHDGDVDVADFPKFLDCLAGPGVTTAPAGCSDYDFWALDLEQDGDVDLADLAAFELIFTTP